MLLRIFRVFDIVLFHQLAVHTGRQVLRAVIAAAYALRIGHPAAIAAARGNQTVADIRAVAGDVKFDALGIFNLAKIFCDIGYLNLLRPFRRSDLRLRFRCFGLRHSGRGKQAKNGNKG